MNRFQESSWPRELRAPGSGSIIFLPAYPEAGGSVLCSYDTGAGTTLGVHYNGAPAVHSSCPMLLLLATFCCWRWPCGSTPGATFPVLLKSSRLGPGNQIPLQPQTLSPYITMAVG